MTEGMKPTPLATTPEAVAEVVVAAVARRRELVWAPAPWRLVMSVFRHVPRAIFRKLPI
jgi:decaprenylphospho-beta-D-erythro-pentofuranosid-2-ulose 2-reductase